jgi:flagellar motor switch protein FliN/FliY
MEMNDGILSQEEIDALLKGNSSNQNLTDNSNSSLGEFEKDTLGEIGNITMGTAATTLSTLLQKKVAITTPDVSITTEEQLQNDYPLPYLVIEVEYTQGLNGTNILVIASLFFKQRIGRDITGPAGNRFYNWSNSRI